MAFDSDRVWRRIDALKDRWAEEEEERKRIQALRQMDDGCWMDKIPHMPQEPAHRDDPEYKPKIAPRLLGFMLDKICRLYDHHPVRELDKKTPKREVEAAAKKLHGWGDGLNAWMGQVERLTRLTGTVLVKPTYREGPYAPLDLVAQLKGRPVPKRDLNEEDGIELQVYPRDTFAVIENPYDATFAEAVVTYMGQKRYRNHLRGEKFIDVHYYWDSDVVVRLEDWKPVLLSNGQDVIVHGYGELPFVVSRNALRVSGDFYTRNLGGTDLYHAILAIGRMLRELGWTSMLQRGQPTVVGEQNPGNIILGPDTPWLIPNADAKVTILENKANLIGMRDTIREMLDVVSMTMGLPAGTWRVELTSNQSGVAIALQRSDLEDDRRGRALLAKGRERAVARKSAIVYNRHRGTRYRWKTETTFPEPPPLLTHEQRTARANDEWERGLISPEDYLKESRPELTDEQIEDRLKRASVYHGQVKTPPPSDPHPPPPDDTEPPGTPLAEEDVDTTPPRGSRGVP